MRQMLVEVRVRLVASWELALWGMTGGGMLAAAEATDAGDIGSGFGVLEGTGES